MTNDMRLLSAILDTGTAMIGSGAETHRVEDSLYRLCASYGFSSCNIWVVPTNIQATVTTSDGECITQIRHVRGAGIDFERLDRLNDLSRRACVLHPSADEFCRELAQITAETPQRLSLTYLGGVLAGAGFGVFFNCDAADTAVAVLASLLITFFGRVLRRKESNPLILNFLIACLTELFILAAVRVGLGHHAGYITVGAVMLLISALGATNGIRDLVHLDTLSGVMNITSSLTGAIGIALGIALPLYLFHGNGSSEMVILNPSVPLELIACTVGCVGFALWFYVKGKKLLFCAVGAFLTWGAYLLAHHALPSAFAATLLGAVVCGLYAQIMARVNKAPATVFLTVCIFPLIPGAALYYTMYGVVTQDLSLAASKGAELLLVCFGIVLGFMVVEVISRYLEKAHL